MCCSGVSRVPGGPGGQAQRPCIIHGCNELLRVSSDCNVDLPRHAADGPRRCPLTFPLAPSFPLFLLSSFPPYHLPTPSLLFPLLRLSFSPLRLCFSLTPSLPFPHFFSTSLPLPHFFSPSLPLSLSPISSLSLPLYPLSPYSFTHHLFSSCFPSSINLSVHPYLWPSIHLPM